MVWNRALSEKEISYLFQTQSGSSTGQLPANWSRSSLDRAHFRRDIAAKALK